MLSWFVYRCPFGKELSLRQNVETLFNVECFVPTKKVRQRDKHGRFVWVQKSVLTGYLFVRIEKERHHLIPRRLIMLHTMMQQAEGLWVPVIVPDNQMASFIRVRVIGGSFVGVEGVFMQIGGKHQKRVIIELEGLIAVATAAIPASMVEKIG